MGQPVLSALVQRDYADPEVGVLVLQKPRPLLEPYASFHEFPAMIPGDDNTTGQLPVEPRSEWPQGGRGGVGELGPSDARP